MQFEADFEKKLKALENDARASAVFVYTEITLHYFFGSDFELLDRVNPLAGFWNGALASFKHQASWLSVVCTISTRARTRFTRSWSSLRRIRGSSIRLL